MTSDGQRARSAFESLLAAITPRATMDAQESDLVDGKRRLCKSLRTRASDSLAEYNQMHQALESQKPSGYASTMSSASAQATTQCAGLNDTRADECSRQVWNTLQPLVDYSMSSSIALEVQSSFVQSEADHLFEMCKSTLSVPDYATDGPQSTRRAIPLDCEQKWAQASAAHDHATHSISLLYNAASSSSFAAWLEANRMATLAQESASEAVDAAAKVTASCAPSSLSAAALEYSRISSSAFKAFDKTTSRLQSSAVAASLSAFNRASSIANGQFTEAMALVSTALQCDSARGMPSMAASTIVVGSKTLVGRDHVAPTQVIAARYDDRAALCRGWDELAPFFPDHGTSGEVFSVTRKHKHHNVSAVMTVMATDTSRAIGTLYNRHRGATDALWVEAVGSSSLKAWVNNKHCYTASLPHAASTTSGTSMLSVIELVLDSKASSSSTVNAEQTAHAVPVPYSGMSSDTSTAEQSASAMPTPYSSTNADSNTSGQSASAMPVPYSGINSDTGANIQLTTLTSWDLPPSPMPGIVHVTVTHTITSTQYVPEPWESHGSVFTTTQTVIDLGSTVLPFTGPMQTLGNSTFVAAPAATLYPFNPHCNIHLLKEMSDEMAHMDSTADRADALLDHVTDETPYIVAIAEQLRRQEPSLAFAIALRYARMCMRQDASHAGKIESICTRSSCHRHKGDCSISVCQHSTVEKRDSDRLPSPSLTMPAPCVGSTCTALVVKPGPSPLACYDPFHFGEDTPNCNRTHPNKHACQIDHCLWKHLRPQNFTTVEQGMMVVREVTNGKTSLGTVLDYFTHSTSVDGRPHWGITDASKTYGPMYLTSTLDGVPRTSAVPVLPMTSSRGFLNSLIHRIEHGKEHKWTTPSCWDDKSCYETCLREHDKKLPWGRIGMLVGAIFGALLLLSLLVLACASLHKRRKNRVAKQGHRDSGVDFLPTQPMEQRTSAMPAMTNAGNAPGAAANPTAAGPATGTERVVVASGDAPAAATDGAQSAGEGRGTTARRAEEGRGRVRFPDGTEKTETTSVTPASAPATAERVEVVPVPAGQPQHASAEHDGHAEALPVPVQHVDGASDRHTGVEVVDMGSIRGRKRNRPSVQNLLGKALAQS